MFRSEVEEWLYSIGLDDLYDSFLEDGFTSLEAVRHMRQSDIDAIVDRRGYMNILNEEIDKLNYGDSLPPIAPTPIRESASRARSYFDYEPEYEDREKLIFRYESRGIPAVGFASRHLARRAKSTARKTRGTSVVGFPSRSSVERYVQNSASQAFESIIASRRAASVAANLAQEAQYQAASAQLLNKQQKREEDRQRRAKTEMQYVANNPDGLSGEIIDRSKFRDHYTNEYVWVERNHITDVGVKYDGLSRSVDHKPSHWRCEDEIERGKEYKRLNDECADKIADNRYSIDNSREWLVDNGGVVDRVHRMSAKTLKTRYDLDSIKRNMENLKSMRARLLKN